MKTTQEAYFGAPNFTVKVRQTSALQSGLGQGGMLQSNFSKRSGLQVPGALMGRAG